MGRLYFCDTLFGNLKRTRCVAMMAGAYRGRLPATSSVAKKFLAALALSTCMVPAAHAAGLSGDTINMTYFFPDLSSPYLDQNANATVSPIATFDGDIIGSRGNATVSSDTILLTFDTGGGTWTTASFNGPVFTVVTKTNPNTKITGAEINPATNMSGLTQSDIAFTSDSVSVNWNGLSFDNNTIVLLDLLFAQTLLSPQLPADAPTNERNVASAIDKFTTAGGTVSKVLIRSTIFPARNSATR